VEHQASGDRCPETGQRVPLSRLLAGSGLRYWHSGEGGSTRGYRGFGGGQLGKPGSRHRRGTHPRV